VLMISALIFKLMRCKLLRKVTLNIMAITKRIKMQTLLKSLHLSTFIMRFQSVSFVIRIKLKILS